MKLPRRIGRALVFCLLLAWPAHGWAARSPASVAASLSDSSVDAGEQTQFLVSVTNGEVEEVPRTPTVDGLTMAYAGKSSSSQYTFNNGSLTQSATTTYVFTVGTERPGRFTVPGQEVHLTDGAVLRTLPVTLTVLGSGNSGGGKDLTYAELVIPKKSAYIGESVPIEVRAGFAANVRHNPSQEVILGGDGFSVQAFTPPRSTGSSTQDGRYTVDLYKSSVAGVKIGTVSVGPATVNPTVQMPRTGGGRRRSFNDPFDPFGQMDPYNVSPPRLVSLKTDAVTLEVKPLPEEGKPVDFSGAIGQFRLAAEAVPNKANTGDPVTVRLRLSGQGNFDRIAPPTLRDEHGLRTYPATAKFKADDEVGLSGTKTFEQVVIAEGPRTTLPSYRFNYLDPATGKYVTVDTPPLAVKIEGRDLATPTPAPAVTTAVPSPSATPTPVPTPARPPEDILYIRADRGVVRDAAAFRPLYRRAGFWAVQGGVLALALALAGGALLRTRRADEVRQRAARAAQQSGDLRRALRREDTGRREFYTAATQLAQLRAGGVGLSAADITQAQGLDPQAAESVRKIFDRHAELAYSGSAAAETPVPTDERRDVLATLDTIGWN